MWNVVDELTNWSFVVSQKGWGSRAGGKRTGKGEAFFFLWLSLFESLSECLVHWHTPHTSTPRLLHELLVAEPDATNLIIDVCSRVCIVQQRPCFTLCNYLFITAHCFPLWVEYTQDIHWEPCVLYHYYFNKLVGSGSDLNEVLTVKWTPSTGEQKPNLMIYFSVVV